MTVGGNLNDRLASAKNYVNYHNAAKAGDEWGLDYIVATVLQKNGKLRYTPVFLIRPEDSHMMRTIADAGFHVRSF